MKDERKDLAETFDKLSPENKSILLAYVHIAYAAQEGTRRTILKAIDPRYASRNPVPMGEAANG
jgi:hypothetical protein